MLVVQEKEGDFKVEFKYGEDMQLIPWFEIYGKHFLSFNPKCNVDVSPLPESETEPIDDEVTVQV